MKACVTWLRGLSYWARVPEEELAPSVSQISSPHHFASIATEERLERRKVFNQEDNTLESGGIIVHSGISGLHCKTEASLKMCVKTSRTNEDTEFYLKYG